MNESPAPAMTDPVNCCELLGHAMDHGWIPHKPETWKYHFASLREPLVIKVWNQRKPDMPGFTEVPLDAGTRVKIVMVSRFGDVGITDDLTAVNGYHARVALDSLTDFGTSA